MRLALLNERRVYHKSDKMEIEDIVGLDKYLPVKLIFERYIPEIYNENKYIYNLYVVCVLVNVTRDFNPYDEKNTILVGSDTDSYQIRPKLIYKDKKGYYYKPLGKVNRLSDTEREIVDTFIKNNR